MLFWSAEEAKEPRPEEIDDSDLRDPGSVRNAVLSLIEKKTGLTVIKRTRTTAERNVCKVSYSELRDVRW